jgi:fumarate reductase flavoprotein subunit
MHGFNRLGGNSLAETVVAGGIIGVKIVEFLKGNETSFNTGIINSEAKRQQERIDNLISGRLGRENVYKVRAEMQEALMQGCFVFRNEKDLSTCVEVLQGLLERSGRIGLVSKGLGANHEVAAALKIQGQVRLAMCIAQAALVRRESRGSHNREDFPARDDKNWLNRTLAYWPEGRAMPELKYEEATPHFEIPPGERGYGGGKIIHADPQEIEAKTITKSK